MPHISKENILELSYMGNEVRAYLLNLYPEFFDSNTSTIVSEVLKSGITAIDSHNETPLEKAKRLYKKDTKFRSLLSNHILKFDKEPKFKIHKITDMIYDTNSGYVVMGKKGKWSEIVEY